MKYLAQYKIGFIGAGNMARSIIGGLVTQISPDKIYASNRTERKLDKLKTDFSIQTVDSNETILDECNLVVLGMKPQDLVDAVEPMRSLFGEEHTVISLAAGVTLQQLKKFMPDVRNIVRVMPNTPISLQRGVVGYCTLKEDSVLEGLVEDLFEASAYVVKTEEGEDFEALMVATSSGVGFVYELMEYWQDWLEQYDFTPEVAKKLTIETFLGASMLADKSETQTIETLKNKVTSKKGVTAAGLTSMQELEVERALRYSFEKAILRNRELSGEAE